MSRYRWVLGVCILCVSAMVSACAWWQQDADQPKGTTASADFGGQPMDQETRDRFHPPLPESARHLGPQEDHPAVSSATNPSNEPATQEQPAGSETAR